MKETHSNCNSQHIPPEFLGGTSLLSCYTISWFHLLAISFPSESTFCCFPTRSNSTCWMISYLQSNGECVTHSMSFYQNFHSVNISLQNVIGCAWREESPRSAFLRFPFYESAVHEWRSFCPLCCIQGMWKHMRLWGTGFLVFQKNGSPFFHTNSNRSKLNFNSNIHGDFSTTFEYSCNFFFPQ